MSMNMNCNNNNINNNNAMMVVAAATQNATSASAAAITANTKYLPSVVHKWTVVNHYADVPLGSGAHADMTDVMYSYKPFIIGSSRLQLILCLPTGVLFIRHVGEVVEVGGGNGVQQNGVGGGGQQQLVVNNNGAVAGERRNLQFRIRLSSMSRQGQWLYGPSNHVVVFTNTIQAVRIATVDYARHREMPFTLVAVVQPETYVSGQPPCDMIVNVCCDRNDPERVVAKFGAHRSVLCASSPVFQAMLGPDSPFKESAEGVLRIRDHSPPTVKAILQYAYTKNEQRFADDGTEYTQAVELLDAVEQYQLSASLKDRCADRMMRLISPRTALQQLVLFDRYHLHTAKQTVIEQLVRNEVHVPRERIFQQLSVELQQDLLNAFVLLQQQQSRCC